MIVHTPRQKIRTWFHNHARPASKASNSKSELKLTQNERRKLAPVQAYCAYAWDSGLRETVIAQWELEKQSYLCADEDDPTADSIETSSSESHIPIDFKLKVARLVYNELGSEEKKKVNDRREDERKKLYRLIPDIPDVEERSAKLRSHKQ